MNKNKSASLIKVYVVHDDKGKELDTFRSTDHVVYLMKYDHAAEILKLKKGESYKCIGFNQQHYSIICIGFIEEVK